MAETLHFYAILFPKSDIQNDISKLNSQIQDLQPGTPEYEYDELVLERERLELQTREENPNLDPQTLAGNEALEQLLAQNPDYQAVVQKIEDLCREHPSECTSWGIPMDFDGAKYIEIK